MISALLDALSRTFLGDVAARERRVAGTLVHGIPSTMARSSGGRQVERCTRRPGRLSDDWRGIATSMRPERTFSSS
jgi:hypothetical protein